MGDVAASGGYYIAAPCNKIYSDASTITGSIGVIFETADLSSLFKKIGMNPETIKSGKYKDIGSPNRPLTPEERKLLQGIVDDTYGTFVRAVSDGRKMSIVDVKKIADGRVFTGAQARKIKLVDEIGGQYETVRAAAVAGGIKGKPKVVEYRKAGWLESVLGGSSARAVDEALRRELVDRLLRGSQSQPLPR
jgi:protease-4